MADILDNVLEIIKNEQCEIEYKKIQQLLEKGGIQYFSSEKENFSVSGN